MSQWDKLIDAILREEGKRRFEDLCRALEKIGYVCGQPRSGSSHYTFRKNGCMPITIPKHYPLNKAYIAMTAEAVRAYLEEDDRNE